MSLDKKLDDDYLCWLESGKQQIKRSHKKIQPENLETNATPKRVWIRIAPPPLSRDRRIKMQKSINQSKNLQNILIMIFKSCVWCKICVEFYYPSVQLFTAFTAPMFELEKETKLLEKTFSLWPKNSKNQITNQEDINFLLSIKTD